jgi:NitT/TauT family transport system substrate-binding protein
MRGGGALLVAIVLLVACSGSPAKIGPKPPTPDASPVTVRVGHVASPLWTPLYVALARGYFDELHVTVELQVIRAGQDPVDLISRNQFDAEVTDFSAPMFDGLARGRQFTLAGSMAAIPSDGSKPLVLEVSKALTDSSQVRTLADLKGRKVAIAGGSGSGSGHLVDATLKPAGIGLKDLTVVDLAAADMETAIASGGIDVALVPGPYSTSMEQHGIAIPMGTPPAGSTWSGVLFSSKLGASAGRRFFQALVRAARELKGPARASDDTVAIVAKYTGRPPEVVKAAAPFDWAPDLAPDTKALAALQDTYRTVGLVHYERNLPDAKYVQPSYSKDAAAALR